MDKADKNVKLSAEVEPFIPQKKGPDTVMIPMALPNDSGGISGMEPTPIPSYLITCYPFVQENQSNRQFPLYNNDIRWQQPNPNPTGPYLAYPIISAQPPVSTEYTYYQLMPAPCAQVMGFYHPFPTPFSTPFQTASAVNTVTTECTDRPSQSGQIFPLSSQRSRSNNRGPIMQKQQQPLQLHIKSKRPPVKSVATQKETSASGPENRSKIVLLVDAAQQTDFPSDIANKSLSESATTMLWKSKGRRRRASHPAAESSSEQGASEADIDSDSGYCSPKHSNNQAIAMTSRNADSGAVNVVDPSINAAGLSWTNVNCQAIQKKPWIEKTQTFSRGGRQAEQRNSSQTGFRCRGHSTSSERQQKLQKRHEKPLTANQLNRTEPSPESLYFEDEDEFPELNSENGSGKGGGIQQKITPKVLDDLPENSPINIVQTPIPITTSVPKRAKSQKKKALAAALATAQEYSEISMEQKKLQEALSKAAGKKSKTPVQLDLGDMLAALEKQQQAMKARQITNTRPLSYTVGSAAPFHTKESANRKSLTKGQPSMGYLNPLDSTAPKVKRGKEREIAKLKRPTALKKIILKEREEKKGRSTVDHSLLGSDEQKEVQISLTSDQSQEIASQEETGLSMPSDTSLSPASQNSPYCMTPVSQGSPASSGIGSPMASSAITKIHSKRFREYCNQVLSKEIDECVTLLLQELVSFQERIYQKDPMRAKARRRLVMGLREVTKHMKLNKIKCVIISPNCEKIQSKGGLDEALYNVIAMAREQEIPFVFALGRKALGRCVNKLVPVSVVGIFNYSGAEDLFNKLVSLTEEARKAYRDMVAAMEQEQAEEALRNVKKAPHHMGHSRNPSAASAISFCSVISEPISEVNEKEYETNWRSMVETSDGLETSENERESSCKATVPEKSVSAPNEKATVNKQSPLATIGTTSTVNHGKTMVSDKEEVKPDDNLEWASQQSTETGSLDGSCRDLLNSSMTSTTSTLVPGMLEEEEEDEEEEDEDYTHEPISVEVQLNSRIESWVSETQRTMETLQLGKTLSGAEEDNTEQSEEEEIETPEQVDAVIDGEEWTADKHTSNVQHKPTICSSLNKENTDSNFMP
ncbi:selenocysteine insertion sequence-binding protein 2-like isoform X1 [Alligator mississippiensis]|uniref:Selenocysteine insertion sequence-binding protein 2-like n=1 Tax=Alligator mississippiensis TaxID=8496 RepID=A0A151M9I4_ALLMI|nr:selenocysteine insertion sequence-binding protein 2-like isoform X1 [Alligator mississippiensis]KYO21177.1 selenocysteine insertion sequence-binding protein 2-like [Alligator mississippiensis]